VGLWGFPGVQQSVPDNFDNSDSSCEATSVSCSERGIRRLGPTKNLEVILWHASVMAHMPHLCLLQTIPQDALNNDA